MKKLILACSVFLLAACSQNGFQKYELTSDIQKEQEIEVDFKDVSIDSIIVAKNKNHCYMLFVKNDGGKFGISEYRDNQGKMVCGKEKTLKLKKEDFYTKKQNHHDSDWYESYLLIDKNGVEYELIQNSGGKLGLMVHYDENGNPIPGI